jgi:hypothetical protein
MAFPGTEEAEAGHVPNRVPIKPRDPLRISFLRLREEGNCDIEDTLSSVHFVSLNFKLAKSVSFSYESLYLSRGGLELITSG